MTLATRNIWPPKSHISRKTNHFFPYRTHGLVAAVLSENILNLTAVCLLARWTVKNHLRLKVEKKIIAAASGQHWPTTLHCTADWCQSLLFECFQAFHPGRLQLSGHIFHADVAVNCLVISDWQASVRGKCAHKGFDVLTDVKHDPCSLSRRLEEDLGCVAG